VACRVCQKDWLKFGCRFDDDAQEISQQIYYLLLDLQNAAYLHQRIKGASCYLRLIIQVLNTNVFYILFIHQFDKSINDILGTSNCFSLFQKNTLFSVTIISIGLFKANHGLYKVLLSYWQKTLLDKNYNFVSYLPILNRNKRIVVFWTILFFCLYTKFIAIAIVNIEVDRRRKITWSLNAEKNI
jgi:hypothetical protein